MNDTDQEEERAHPNGDSNVPIHPFWKAHLPLERETCWFILVNALDVFMTFILLSLEDFHESNAIANFFLTRWGIRGMVYFKFAVVAFIAVVAQLAAHKNIKIGRRLLNFGTLLTGGVVIYSFYLLLAWIGR